MSEIAEKANETIHEHGDHTDPWARRVAVLVSVLAAVLAITGVGAKSTENAYLTHHIAVSDDWAFYQAKNLRSAVRSAEVNVLSSLPNADDAVIQGRIKEARDYVARAQDDPQTGDGMKQLAEKTHHQEEIRAHAFHQYHLYEYAAGVLEIAIVLSSVSVVTRIRSLAKGAAVMGVAAAVLALCVAADLV